ncbi:mitochondrial 37S ribosomal protein MRPS8 [Paracoccidioides lutzii Pb01]|uniref:Mitochondrial 37S ribosomal protein S8 n=1 Tax=Paracoccidioides lutzii (strain ATCC MYA-826 / Pb01) TaxID=502779 RepID=C1H6J2_PARBA|nr:mitochondrial 37S ribosomal protein MRPS8 [Paracoccidioides lutzii Pb01]EEH35336.1 mitochondrial 37S ribosomal protein S8 [Paracoccidioides lutzii Pb01]
MSLSNLAQVCSSITNASKARLAIISISNTKLHRNLSIALRNTGFISTVVLGGCQPPPQHILLKIPAANDEVEPVEPVTTANIASRRLWLGLKYWQNEPVITKMSLVSKPKRRLTLTVPKLRHIVLGEKRGTVEGLRSPGECLFLLTNRGILEARECVEKMTGGLALCRVI